MRDHSALSEELKWQISKTYKSNTKKWVNDINDLIIHNKIDLIYPSNSMIIDALVREKDKIQAKILLPNNK